MTDRLADGKMAMIIDAFTFARNGQHLAGEIALAKMQRIDVQQRDGVLSYQVRGFTGERGRSFLGVKVQGALVLRCERCLQPLDWPLNVDSVLWLARSEAEADAEPVERDDYDPIVGSDRLDLNELIEDEVLLAIPTVPKHLHCPNALEVPRQGPESPFAALAALKKPGSGGLPQ